jgi:hypothetical protein
MLSGAGPIISYTKLIYKKKRGYKVNKRLSPIAVFDMKRSFLGSED